jgi:signal transduction histidine kinase
VATFSRLNLAHQFLIVSFVVLIIGMLLIGAWVGRQIEIGVVNRTAAVTALYVDSFVSPYLQDLTDGQDLTSWHLERLNFLLTNTALGERIVAFKVWSPTGEILYSNNAALIGRHFPVDDHLQRAFAGEIQTGISDLTEAENEFERLQWSRLIETYAPVRLQGTDTIVAVSEFYQTTNELERAVQAAQFQSWLMVGAVTVATYLLLAGIVNRANRTILSQQHELRDKVAHLSQLLAQNDQLHKRVRRAAAQTTALNERFLRRISADLHDGPGQDLGLALLRIEALAERCISQVANGQDKTDMENDFHTVQSALQSALKEMRTISAGLRLPEIGRLSPAETVARAVSDYERKSGQMVMLQVTEAPPEAPLPLKITLYRLVQESLANGFRHANGIGQRVAIAGRDGQLTIEVSDAGQGFDINAVISEGHLGLDAMRERVEILGGTFEVRSGISQGTIIRANLPLSVPGVEDE